MFSNLRLKLLAIFFAVALWSVVAYTSNPTGQKSYTLAVDHPALPAGLVIVGDIPQVKVTVIGTADNLQHFDSRTLHVSGNFSNVKVGNNEVPIRVEKGDPAVQVDAPTTVAVTVDQLATVTLNVSIERVHSLLPGFHEQANSASVTPTSVQVSGPKSSLTGLVAVVRPDLSDVQAPGINTTYAVVVHDANNRIPKSITVAPPNVTLKLVVQADAITVDKAVGFTLTGQPAAGYRVSNVTITPLQVQATGLQNALGGISVLGTDPIDVSNAKADIVKTVVIRAPDGVTVSPKTATVHVFISQAPGVSPSP
ncbi:MAG TPA: CdaR family protein [Candidatus Acidoferrum sp.]|nr:CdaR family protein [Candidatus Acidoferrum sp.]